MAYFEAKAAVGIMGIREFIEAKLKQFTKRVKNKDYVIEVREDGTTEIKRKKADQETLDYPRDQDIQREYAEVQSEIAALDQKIREKEDKLAEIKDRREIARRDNPAPEPIMREIRGNLFWFFVFFAVEVVTITLFFKDLFPENLLLLVSLAVGTCGGTFILLGLPIIRLVEKRRFMVAIPFSFVLIFWGFGLGCYRALSVTDGEMDWGLFTLFTFLNISSPLAQAWFGEKCLKARSKHNETLEVQRRLRPIEIETEAELRRLKRLREDAIKRREGLGKRVTEIEERESRKNESEKLFLKDVEARLTIYRQAYLYWRRKRGGPNPPIKPKEVKEWPDLKVLPYS
jgi:hypothetical protein